MQGANLAGRSHNLPVRLTSLLGREQAIGQLLASLRTRRVVTIIGPGGIGRSTVALAVAEASLERFGGAVRLVDLALCFDDRSVLARVAAVIEFGDTSPPAPEALAAHLEQARMLLLLDNCEHVVQEVAGLVAALYDRAPGVQVLATSREALSVPDERIYRLASLELPPRDELMSAEEAKEFPAVQLLIDRAAATGFRFGDGDVEAVSEICHRLDGIPLALELAAARMPLFGAQALCDRLDSRFELLSGGRRTALPRQQTLQAAIDWSFETLDGDEQTALLCLSAFRGPFALDAALRLLAAVGLTSPHAFQIVMSLAAKSLVAVSPDRDSTRYRLLESTREYGLQKLRPSAIAAPVFAAHAEICLALLGGAKPDMLLLPRNEWTARYGALVGDLQSAFSWAFSKEGNPDVGLALVAAAGPLADQLYLTREFFEHATGVLRADGAATAEEAALRLSLPLLHMQVHVHGKLSQGIESSLVATRLQEELAQQFPEVLAVQFGAALVGGRYAEALDVADRLRRLAVGEGEPALAVLASRVSAQAHYYLGHFAEAQRYATEVIGSHFEFLPYSAINHRVSMRVILAACAAIESDFIAARDLASEAVQLGRRDNPVSHCLALALGGVPVAVWLGDEALAREWNAEARSTAERHSLQFWSITASDLQRGIEHVWGAPPYPAQAAGLVESIGPTNCDTLPTFSPTLITPLALDRVVSGKLGWNAAEILRIDATTDRSASPEAARDRLFGALLIAQDQGAKLWQARIEKSLAAISGAKSGAGRKVGHG